MHSLRRLLPLLFCVGLLAFVAGCGSDSGPDTSSSSSTASVSSDSPLSDIPADAPLAITVSTDLDSGQLADALSFASKLETTGRDLKAELIKSFDDGLSDENLNFDTDIKPWLGKTAALYFDTFTSDAGGAFVVQTSDSAKAKAFLDKEASAKKYTKGTYSGTTYQIDPDDKSVDGMVGDFVVGASDVDHFKAVVDASKGSSLADGDKYKTAVGRLSSSDNLAIVYADVDGLLSKIAASGSIPQATLDTVKKNPAYKPGETVAAALTASSDKMSLETASDNGSLGSIGDAEDLGSLAEGWLAFAAPIDGKNLGAGFEQGLQQAGGDPAITQAIDAFGIQDFLAGLKGITLRAGGTSLTSINGSFKIAGSNEAATKKLFDTALQEAKSASQGQVQINVSGNTATANAGPYSVKLTADGADLDLTFGDQPSGKLSDLDSYKSASDDLDGGKPLFFLDFGPLGQLVKAIPSSDSDTAMAQQVLAKLGTFVLGTETDGDVARGKAVLTLAGG